MSGVRQYCAHCGRRCFSTKFKPREWYEVGISTSDMLGEKAEYKNTIVCKGCFQAVEEYLGLKKRSKTFDAGAQEEQEGYCIGWELIEENGSENNE